MDRLIIDKNHIIYDSPFKAVYKNDGNLVEIVHNIIYNYSTIHLNKRVMHSNGKKFSILKVGKYEREFTGCELKILVDKEFLKDVRCAMNMANFSKSEKEYKKVLK